MAKDALQIAFGKEIRKHRESLGISQEELADRAGLHRTYISLLERGHRNPTLGVTRRLGIALGVSMTSIVRAVEREI